jgi:hypothetical protein
MNTPNVDAALAGTWADWMLRVINERIRDEALAKLLRPTNPTKPA